MAKKKAKPAAAKAAKPTSHDSAAFMRVTMVGKIVDGVHLPDERFISQTIDLHPRAPIHHAVTFLLATLSKQISWPTPTDMHLDLKAARQLFTAILQQESNEAVPTDKLVEFLTRPEYSVPLKAILATLEDAERDMVWFLYLAPPAERKPIAEVVGLFHDNPSEHDVLHMADNVLVRIHSRLVTRLCVVNDATA